MRICARLVAVLAVSGCSGGGGGDEGPKTGLVVVTVVVGGIESSGEDVVFHDPDGNVLEHLVTGSDGTVSRVIDRGEMVTAAHIADYGDHELVTLTSLVPLEDLRFEFSSWDETVVATAELNAAPFPGATDYVADYPCGLSFSGDPAFSLDLEADCFDDAGRLDVAITAEDDTGEPIAWSLRMDAEIPPGSTTPVTMPAWRSDFRQLPVDITRSSPAAVNGYVFSSTVVQNHVQVPFASRAFDSLPFSATLPSLPPGPEQSLLVMVLTEDSWLIDLDPSEPGSFTMSDDELLLPTDLSVEDFGSARPLASWAGPFSFSIDAERLYLRWEPPASGDFNTWTVFAKPKAIGTFRFPDLPDALSAFRPEGPEEGGLSVEHIESSMFIGYGDVRRGGHLHYMDFPDINQHFRQRLSWDQFYYP